MDPQKIAALRNQQKSLKEVESSILEASLQLEKQIKEATAPVTIQFRTLLENEILTASLAYTKEMANVIGLDDPLWKDADRYAIYLACPREVLNKYLAEVRPEDCVGLTFEWNDLTSTFISRGEEYGILLSRQSWDPLERCIKDHPAWRPDMDTPRAHLKSVPSRITTLISHKLEGDINFTDLKKVVSEKMAYVYLGEEGLDGRPIDNEVALLPNRISTLLDQLAAKIQQTWSSRYEQLNSWEEQVKVQVAEKEPYLLEATAWKLKDNQVAIYVGLPKDTLSYLDPIMKGVVTYINWSEIE